MFISFYRLLIAVLFLRIFLYLFRNNVLSIEYHFVVCDLHKIIFLKMKYSNLDL